MFCEHGEKRAGGACGTYFDVGLGLAVRFRRRPPEHRLIYIQRQRTVRAAAKPWLWRGWQMAGLIQPAAMALPHGHQAVLSPYLQNAASYSNDKFVAKAPYS